MPRSAQRLVPPIPEGRVTTMDTVVAAQVLIVAITVAVMLLVWH